MNALRRLIAGCWGIAFAIMSTTAAAATNYSDQWYMPNEAGWGVSVHQQGTTLVLDIATYRANGQPTWFTAVAPRQASIATDREVFAGDLYETLGPAYTDTFNPAQVSGRKVGTLTFDAATPESATPDSAILSYWVDSVFVAKVVSRQTWALENLSGTYDAIWDLGCGLPSPSDFTETKIQHAANGSVTMDVAYWVTLYDPASSSHLTRGVYFQAGHVGLVAAMYNAGTNSYLGITDIEFTDIGFTGRIVLASNTCPQDGRIVAVRRL